jgi:hypothetical protein
MGECSALATKAELKALEDKFIPKVEKAGILSSAANTASQIAAAAIAVPTAKAIAAQQVGQAAHRTASQARGDAARAKGFADRAINTSQQANRAVNNVANATRAAEARAMSAIQRAEQRAGAVAAQYGRANASANAATRKIAQNAQAIGKKAGFDALYAQSRASSAAATASRAMSGVGRALSLVGGVIGILSSFATVAMVAVLTAQVARALKIAQNAEDLALKNKEAIRIANIEITNQRKTLQNQERRLVEQQDSIDVINSQIIKIDGLIKGLYGDIKARDVLIEQLQKRDGEIIEAANAASKKAEEAITKANEALNKLPPPRIPEDLTEVWSQINQLQRQNELLKSDNNALRVALNTALSKLEQKEDKFIVRRVEKATITNASGIRDLNGQVVGLPSKFGSQLDGVTKTITEQYTKADIDTKNNIINSGGIGKQQVERIVDTKLKDVTKMNEQQSNQINSKLDKIDAKTNNFPSVTQIAIAVGALDILRQINSKPSGGGTCLAPALVPPVAAQTRANFGAIGTLQGVTITQNAVLQKGVSAVNEGMKAVGTVVTKIDKTVHHAQHGLKNAFDLANRAWKATHLDKVMSALSVVIALHNAAMLSRNLGQTLGDLTSQALSTIGIKDSEGSPLNINGAIGQQVNNMLTSILGAETYQGIKETWNKSSRILSSASQIVWTVRSIADSTREITEWTAENTGKIGNALRRFRVVGQNAYGWMPERMNSTNKWLARVERARQGVDSLDDAASSFSSVLGEVNNIQQEYSELQEQKTKFQDNVKDLTPNVRDENTPVKDLMTDEKAASKAPSSMPDVFRGEGETS